MNEAILLVEDNSLLRQSLAFSLRHAGFRVLTAADAEDGLIQAGNERPDIVLLDIGLPGMDGLRALGEFRERFALPVILLTARRGSRDEALGLELGADDYVSKPFDLDVLLARIRATLRRSSQAGAGAGENRALSVGELCIDPAARTTYVNRQLVTLPPRAFDLLYVLAAQAGSVVRLNTLLDQVWGVEFSGEDQVVYVHIRSLRKCLESIAGHSVRIQTVHRVGYKLVVHTN
jgi:DNA-binding response OmpR family regulator